MVKAKWVMGLQPGPDLIHPPNISLAQEGLSTQLGVAGMTPSVGLTGWVGQSGQEAQEIPDPLGFADRGVGDRGERGKEPLGWLRAKVAPYIPQCQLTGHSPLV